MHDLGNLHQLRLSADDGGQARQLIRLCLARSAWMQLHLFRAISRPNVYYSTARPSANETDMQGEFL